MALFFSFTALVYAANPPSQGLGQVGTQVGREGGYSTDDIGLVFANLVNWFAWFIALVSVIMGLYAGLLFITSSGDETKLKKARDTFMYTIIGIVVAIISFGIVAIAEGLI